MVDSYQTVLEGTGIGYYLIVCFFLLVLCLSSVHAFFLF